MTAMDFSGARDLRTIKDRWNTSVYAGRS